MVQGSGLLNRDRPKNRSVGSNPTSSANNCLAASWFLVTPHFLIANLNQSVKITSSIDNNEENKIKL